MAFAALVSLLILTATGCTTGFSATLFSIENDTGTTMSMSYQKFSGYKERKIDIAEENTPVEVVIESESGDISLSIKDEDGKAYYEGTKLPSSQFTVELGHAGSYVICVEAKSHSGRYQFSWGAGE